MDFKRGVFPRYNGKEFVWYMPKIIEFLDRDQLSSLRLEGKTMNDVFKRCEDLTQDMNFLYLVSLFKDDEILNVYTVHAINARRLENDDFYSRIDEVDQFWQSTCECDDNFFRAHH